MNRVFSSSINYLCYILLVIISLQCIACGSGKIGTEKEKTGKAALLVYSDDARKNGTYEPIKGNIPRFKAMVCGQFVQYVLDEDKKDGTYTPWLVNSNKDSVVLYRIPASNTNKDGHWIYHYQCLTSLEEEPIYTAFSKLVEINRDSILEIYYEVPEDFKLSLAKIIKKPKDAFQEINFSTLKVNPEGEVVYYERESILSYTGYSSLRPTAVPKVAGEGGYDGEYYEVTPELYKFKKLSYSKEEELVRTGLIDHLIKLAYINLEYIY